MQSQETDWNQSPKEMGGLKKEKDGLDQVFPR